MENALIIMSITIKKQKLIKLTRVLVQKILKR